MAGGRLTDENRLNGGIGEMSNNLYSSLFGTGDSAEVTAMKRGGMTSEYYNTIADLWSQKSGQRPGEIHDKIKSDRNFADKFWQILNTPQEELYTQALSDPDTASFLQKTGLISEAEFNKRKETADASTKLINDKNTAISEAFKGNFITQEEADRLKGADIDSVKEYISKATDKVLNPVEKYTYNEPEYLKQAKAQLQLDLAAPDTLSTDMVKKWQPYFEQLSAPEIKKELDTIGQTMNAKGRLFSGQTLNKESDLRTSYDQSNLANALNLGLQEWNQNQAKRTGAQSKAMQLAAFEEGVNQYANDKEANAAMQEMVRNWSNIDTANKTQFDLSNIYRKEASDESDYNKNLAILEKYLNASKSANTGFDYTKLLQPAATIATAFI